MTPRRWRRWALAAAILTVSAALPLAPVGAQTSRNPTTSDYDDVVKRLERARRLVREAEQRERGLKSQISSASAQRRAVEIEVEELTALVDSAQGRLNEAESALAMVQQELVAKTEELQRLLQDLQEAHETLTSRAVTLYKRGPMVMADYVLGATDFSDLSRRLRLAAAVMRSDEEKMDLIRTASDRVSAERDEIEALRQRASEQVAAVQAERDRVAALRASVDSRRRSLSSELNQLGGQLASTKQTKEKYLAEQRALEQESARIRSFLRGRTSGAASVSAGAMSWPVSGPVTSGYGWRTHPIFGTRRFHSGIDIGAPSGRGVSASAPGTVIFAGVQGGYGNTVIVDHGGGLATLYAHLSSISAGNGSSVRTGSRVGAVGCTGYCTGPHLHFEVRVNGEPQNPMRWLS